TVQTRSRAKSQLRAGSYGVWTLSAGLRTKRRSHETNGLRGRIEPDGRWDSGTGGVCNLRSAPIRFRDFAIQGAQRFLSRPRRFRPELVLPGEENVSRGDCSATKGVSGLGAGPTCYRHSSLCPGARGEEARSREADR